MGNCIDCCRRNPVHGRDVDGGLWRDYATGPVVLALVQRIWADGVAKAAIKAAKAAEEVKTAADDVKEKLLATSNEQRVSMAIIQQTTARTYMKVNGQYGLYLRNLAMLARNHATMAREVAKKSGDPRDDSVAGAAELMALSTESDYLTHLQQQEAIDIEQSKTINAAKSVVAETKH